MGCLYHHLPKAQWLTEKGQEDLRRQNSGREIVSSRSNSTTDSWTHGGCGCLHKPYTFKSVRILAWSEELRIPHPWLRGHWQQMDPERELGTTMWCWEWNQSFLEKTKQNNNNAGSHNIQHIQGHRSWCYVVTVSHGATLSASTLLA